MVIVCPTCGHVRYSIEIRIPQSQRERYPGTPRRVMATNRPCQCDKQPRLSRPEALDAR